MTIVMNDFKGEPEELIAAQMEAVERVIRSGWWVLGQEVKQFETEWANWLGVEHAVGVGNGMDAIEIGLRAIGIGPGDEVITTPMTAFATVLAILRAGATPVLADIDPATAMLDPESVKRCISSRTKAVILVHLYGQAGPADVLAQLCKEHGISLVEDCAQAHGAKLHGRPAGSFGAFAAWSFYPTKNLGAIGDGGALTTASSELAEKARSLRNYGQSVRYHHPLIGMNSRLDEMQAAILRARLKYLHNWTDARRKIAQAYASGINNPAVCALPLPGNIEQHVYHLFVVTAEHRDGLQAHLKQHDIDSLIHYPIPVHFQKPGESMKRDPAGLKAAEKHALTCLSLPCHPGLSAGDIEKVIKSVNSFAG